RAPRAVLVQTTRPLSELRRPPHGGEGGTPRRSRPADVPVRQWVLTLCAISSPTITRSAARCSASPYAPCSGSIAAARRARACATAERRRDGDPALRGRPPTERPLPHPPLGRRLRRGRRREPRVPRRRAAERRGGGAAARHHLPARPASPRAPRTRRR